MVSEEFSFPKITSSPLPHFAIPSSSSPSLWRVSSVVYPADFSDQLDAKFKSFENNEGPSYKSKSKGDQMITDEHEKMDLLWEDFNEELQRVNSSFSNSKQLSDISSDCNKFCCVKPSKNISSKPTAISYQPKKQSLVLVLKKIFLLHKSSPIKKN